MRVTLRCGHQLHPSLLAAHVLPRLDSQHRCWSTVAVGRLGNVAASYVGSRALCAGGLSSYFLMWAAALTLVFVLPASIRRHIGGDGRRSRGYS